MHARSWIFALRRTTLSVQAACLYSEEISRISWLIGDDVRWSGRPAR
jgi:hypothetical protein